MAMLRPAAGGSITRCPGSTRLLEVASRRCWGAPLPVDASEHRSANAGASVLPRKQRGDCCRRVRPFNPGFESGGLGSRSSGTAYHGFNDSLDLRVRGRPPTRSS